VAPSRGVVPAGSPQGPVKKRRSRLQMKPGGTQWRRDRAVLIFMIATFQPLLLASKAAFRWLVDQLCPGYVPSCTRTMVRNHLDPLYEHFSGEIGKQVVDGSWFHLSIDGWKLGRGQGRASNRYVVGITASYVDSSFQRRKFTVRIVEIFGLHNAPNISRTVIDAVEAAGIPFDRVVSISSDNAAEEVKAVEAIRAAFESHSILQVRCYCHTLNLATQDALKVCCCFAVLCIWLVLGFR